MTSVLGTATMNVLEYAVNIGLDVGKERYLGKIDENKLHDCLVSYIESHRKYNEVCLLAEEIDFQGLVDYVDFKLISEISTTIFTPDRKVRGVARNKIFMSADSYSKADTDPKKQKVHKFIGTLIDIFKEFYRNKISYSDWILANEIVDSISAEINDLGTDVKNNLIGLTNGMSQIADTLSQNIMFTPEAYCNLTKEKKWGSIESNLDLINTIISKGHPFYPDYGFKQIDSKLFSVPLNSDALIRNPPKFICHGTAKMGDTKLNHLDKSVIDYADRHQLKIILNIADAKKLLGDYPDPVQHEADELKGKCVIREPKPFPPAFPCSINVDGLNFYEYVELRTVEILDDGTYIVNNYSQKNCSFKIELKINLEGTDSKITYNMTNNYDAANKDHLIFLKMMRQASYGGKLEIYAYNLKTSILAGKIDSFTYNTGFGDIEEEINFLERVVSIENYFGRSIIIPETIYEKDYHYICYISNLINGMVNENSWDGFKLKMIIDKNFREKISETKDEYQSLCYVGTIDVPIFNEILKLPIIREYKEAKIKNLDRFQKKLAYSDDGEEIEIHYMAGENNKFVDRLQSENFPSLEEIMSRDNQSIKTKG